MKLSYLITCSNETTSLINLLSRVLHYINNKTELIVLLDSECLDNDPTKKILFDVFGNDNWYYTHALNKNYSEHKNWGLTKCTGDFVFQIDGDELPTDTLLLNIEDIISENTGIETFWIPRINDFIGVTSEHAKTWGWKLTESVVYKRPIVNFPDYQGRVFLNDPTRIKWIGNLHERLCGNKTFAYLPEDEDLALYHDKTISTQIETNLRYNKLFTIQENQGFKLPV